MEVQVPYTKKIGYIFKVMDNINKSCYTPIVMNQYTYYWHKLDLLPFQDEVRVRFVSYRIVFGADD